MNALTMLMSAILNETTITTGLAIWGAILSSVLFYFKVREIIGDRFRLSISLGINTLGEDTNVIEIFNHSKKPILIDGLDLFWSKDVKDINSHMDIQTGYEQDCSIMIQPNSVKRLVFEEQYSFAILPDRGNLYIRLNIVGRKKPVTRQLY